MEKLKKIFEAIYSRPTIIVTNYPDNKMVTELKDISEKNGIEYKEILLDYMTDIDLQELLFGCFGLESTFTKGSPKMVNFRFSNQKIESSSYVRISAILPSTALRLITQYVCSENVNTNVLTFEEGADIEELDYNIALMARAFLFDYKS